MAEYDIEKNSNGQHDGHSDAERNKLTSDDDACFKLWTVYIDEAERYDKALLEGWRQDMDGMLLFSALYTASLTAFVIESYKTLREDPQDTTVSLLTQISQQLASQSNGPPESIGELNAFQPSLSSLICNTFWFISLVLGLTCSLLATFVQQWTRDFIHKTTMRPSPVLSARILAFSYLGLRRFGMHTFVDVIPILLHASLFLFFAGLIGFLQPVNAPLMYLMACTLFVFALVYMSLTLIPLISLDAPYRTPLSGILWYMGTMVNNVISRRPTFKIDSTLTERMLEKSREEPKKRDRQCMEYTIKSLSYDTELLKLLKTIPEAICGPNGARLANWPLIASLMQSSKPEHNVVHRISSLIATSSFKTSFGNQHDSLMIVIKALWSLAYLLVQKPREIPSIHSDSVRVFWFDRILLNRLRDFKTALGATSPSALALVRTSRMQGLKYCIDEMTGHLFSTSSAGWTKLQNVWKAVSEEDIDWDSQAFKSDLKSLRALVKGVEACSEASVSSEEIERLVEQAKVLVLALQRPERWKAAQVSILGEYLTSLAANHDDDADDAALATELLETTDLICSSLRHAYHDEVHDPYDPSLDLNEDEAAPSFAIQHFEDVGSDCSNLDLIFGHSLKLFFATKHALSPHTDAVKCRSAIEMYISNKACQRGQVIENDTQKQIERCLIQDLCSGQNSRRCIVGIQGFYLAFGLATTRDGITPRLYDFAKLVLQNAPQASLEVRQHSVFNLVLAFTERVLCRHLLYVFQRKQCLDMETMDALRQRLLPEVALPTEGLDTQQGFLLSMMLVALSNLIRECCRIDMDATHLGHFEELSCCFWKEGQRYNGPIHEKSQIVFSQAVLQLVQSPSRKRNDSAARQFFHEAAGIWFWSQMWPWITDVQAANTLIKAIDMHKRDDNSRMIYYEQNLLDRCNIIRERESGEGSAVDEPGGGSTVDESEGGSTVDESGEDSTVDESGEDSTIDD